VDWSGNGRSLPQPHGAKHPGEVASAPFGSLKHQAPDGRRRRSQRNRVSNCTYCSLARRV
jgi:hypothetical protein